MKLTMRMILLTTLALTVSAAAEPAKAKPAPVAPALLVIDVQNAYLPFMDEKDKKMAMEGINYYISLFRVNGLPVIRVYHSDPVQGWPKPGSEEFHFPKTVAVRDDDPLVVKNYGNAFKKTELDKLLKENGCNTVFLCGLSAVGCVLATYHGALDNDYEVFLCREALISHDGALTKAVQEFCRTIDYSALKLLLSGVRR